MSHCISTIPGHNYLITDLSVLSDDVVASAAGDNTIRINNIRTGKCQHVLIGHKGGVNCIVVVRLGTDGILASGSDDGTIRIWNLLSGSCIKTIQCKTGKIYCLCLLDKNKLISGSENDSIQIWNIKTGKCDQILICPNMGSYKIALISDTWFATSGPLDKTIRFWVKKDQWEEHQTLDSKMVTCMTAAETLVDNEYTMCIFYGTFSRMIVQIDTYTGETIQKYKGHTDTVSCLTVVPDHKEWSLISGACDHKIKCWNIETGCCMIILSGHKGSVYALTTLPNGLIVSGSADRTIKVWNTSLRKEIVPMNKQHIKYAFTEIKEFKPLKFSKKPMKIV